MGVQLYDAALALVSPADRPPNRYDDTTRGYTTTSVWQYRGQIWVPYSVGAGAAVWRRQPPQQGRILDLLGSAGKVGWGTVALKAGYTGPAIDISCTVSGSTVTGTVNILANGELDVAGLMAIAGKRDAGTEIIITKGYDQSGNGLHATQYGSVAMPILIYDEMMGRWCAVGENDVVVRTLGNASGPTVTANNCAMYMLGRPGGSADNAALVIGTFGQYSGTNTSAFELQSSPNGGLQAWGGGTGSNATTQPYPIMDLGPCIVGMNSRPSGGNELFCNERSGIATGQLAQSLTGYLTGYDNISAGRYMACRTIGFVLADAAPTSAVAQAIRWSAYTLMNVAPQARDVVAYIGDSRFAGFRASYLGNPALQARINSRMPHTALNFGCGSRTALQMITTTVPQAVRYYQAGRKNIAVVLAGINDLIVNGATAAQTQSYLSQNCQLMKAAGFYVILIPEVDGNSPTHHNFMVALRALIVAAGAAAMNADEILDVTDMAPVTTPSDTVLYPDGLHFSGTLGGLIGSRIAERIDALLTAP